MEHFAHNKAILLRPVKVHIRFTIKVQSGGSIIIRINIVKRMVLVAINAIACPVLVIKCGQQKGCHAGYFVNIFLILGNSLKLSPQLAIAW